MLERQQITKWVKIQTIIAQPIVNAHTLVSYHSLGPPPDDGSKLNILLHTPLIKASHSTNIIGFSSVDEQRISTPKASMPLLGEGEHLMPGHLTLLVEFGPVV